MVSLRRIIIQPKVDDEFMIEVIDLRKTGYCHYTGKRLTMAHKDFSLQILKRNSSKKISNAWDRPGIKWKITCDDSLKKFNVRESSNSTLGWTSCCKIECQEFLVKYFPASV